MTSSAIRKLSLACLAGLPFAAMGADAPSSSQGSSLTVGAGVAAAPTFAGSRDVKATVLPLLDYQHQSGFFASTQRGIGWDGGSEGIQYRLAVNARSERNDKEHKAFSYDTGGKQLLGMGTVKASAVGLAGVTLRLGKKASLKAGVELPLTQRTNGSTVQFGGDYLLLGGGKDSISLGSTLEAGDGKYMRTYFGVTGEQSLRSGYSVYTPKAGLYKASLNLGWTHQIDEHWSLVSTAGVGRLLGDASRSPLAFRKTSAQGAVMVSYAY